MVVFRVFLTAVFDNSGDLYRCSNSSTWIWIVSSFLRDIAKLGWAGQFNLDFMAMLAMSALWVAWRNSFHIGVSACGVAFFGGAPFLCIYLLF